MEISKKLVRETLEKRFSATEIKVVVEQLNISYVEIEGGGLKKEIFELVEYSDKHGLLESLWNFMNQTRPDILLNLPKEVADTAICQYLDRISSEKNIVDLVGFSSKFRMKIEFEKVFISMFLSKPVHLSPLFDALDKFISKIEPVEMSQLLNPTYSNLIIFGPLGCGKTSLLKHFLRETAVSALKMGGRDLPVFIEFSLYSRTQTNSLQMEQIIVETLSEGLGIKINLPVLNALGWNLKFLFNHFDDLPSKLKRQAVIEVEKILANHSNCSIIVSCNSAESASQLFDTTKSFYVAKILPLTKNQTLDLTHRLYEVISQDISGSNISLSDVQNLICSPDLTEWVRTPLEVTVAVSCIISTQIFRSEAIATLVRKKILTMWLFEWDQKKSQTSDETENEISAFKNALFFMAYHTYNETDSQLVIPIEAGAEYLVDMGFYQAPARARRELIEAMGRIKNATELLAVPELEFSTNYKFKNQTIREILAAIYLFSIPADARKRILETKFDVNSWRPLFVLLFDIFIYQSVSEAEQYLDLIICSIPFLDRLSEKGVDRLMLVSDCIRRGKLQNIGFAEKVKGIIIEILNDREQKVSLRNRIALAEYLGEFGDPRIGAEIKINEGKFWIGYDPFPNDRPVRKIFLPAYTVDAYPITNQDFGAFIKDQGYSHEGLWNPDGWKWVQKTNREFPKYWFDPRFNKANYPVVGVSWFEADAFARWAGKRLPTETEWEKAARGTDGNEWTWGNSFNGMNLNCSDSTEIIHGTTPIGIYPAGQSSYGVFDMAGNVSEWVDDWYDAYPGNPNRDTHYGNNFKVRRGGGWGADRDFVRCTCRNASPRTADYAVCGFRCCK